MAQLVLEGFDQICVHMDASIGMSIVSGDVSLQLEHMYMMPRFQDRGVWPRQHHRGSFVH